MKTFKIGKDLEIVCEWKKTRTAFKHEATLIGNGREINKVKICYLNRTWEAYEFDSVIQKLLDDTKGFFTQKQKDNFFKKITRINEGKSDSQFRAIAQVAKFGEVFGQNQKETNDWKTRMLKAGLENQGLIMPEDWDTLDEDTKQARLDAVIKLLNS